MTAKNYNAWRQTIKIISRVWNRKKSIVSKWLWMSLLRDSYSGARDPQEPMIAQVGVMQFYRWSSREFPIRICMPGWALSILLDPREALIQLTTIRKLETREGKSIQVFLLLKNVSELLISKKTMFSSDSLCSQESSRILWLAPVRQLWLLM